jgi:hypothetical protein
VTLHSNAMSPTDFCTPPDETFTNILLNAY